MMVRFVRSVSLIVAVLALKVGAVRDGAACPFAMDRAAHASEPVATMDMATMEHHPATPGADDEGRPEGSTPAKPPCGPDGGPLPCPLFAPCAPVFVAPPPAIDCTAAPHAVRALALVDRVPDSVVRTPEPPPPRA